uniref:Tail tube protein n=1 Tax=Siphoviridae sp. ctdcr45 TaxID=2825580 RepID=A0A8S5Q8W4_9CAUD|nr:MAG TPA: tail tube protein [Siphoviridae sp. ctdcr45]
MAKSRSVGTKLLIAPKTGNTDVEVGALSSVSGIDASADEVEVTDMGNTDGYREYLPGFKDGGEVSLSGYMDGEDEGQARLYELMESGDVVDCKIQFPAKIGKTWSFKAGVTKFTTSADVDDAITFEATLKVSGKPTLAATTTSDT